MVLSMPSLTPGMTNIYVRLTHARCRDCDCFPVNAAMPSHWRLLVLFHPSWYVRCDSHSVRRSCRSSINAGFSDGALEGVGCDLGWA